MAKYQFDVVYERSPWTWVVKGPIGTFFRTHFSGAGDAVDFMKKHAKTLSSTVSDAAKSITGEVSEVIEDAKEMVEAQQKQEQQESNTPKAAMPQVSPSPQPPLQGAHSTDSSTTLSGCACWSSTSNTNASDCSTAYPSTSSASTYPSASGTSTRSTASGTSTYPSAGSAPTRSTLSTTVSRNARNRRVVQRGSVSIGEDIETLKD